MWWTFEADAGLSHPPGQAQCLSRRMTARRICVGIEFAKPMSSGRLGVLYGCSSRPVRSADARPPGPAAKSMASRAIANRWACRALEDRSPGPVAWASTMILSITVMSAWPVTTGTVSAVGDHAGADEELAGLLQAVVEPLLLTLVVFRS